MVLWSLNGLRSLQFLSLVALNFEPEIPHLRIKSVEELVILLFQNILYDFFSVEMGNYKLMSLWIDSVLPRYPQFVLFRLL